jgi:hypothetical protein
MKHHPATERRPAEIRATFVGSRVRAQRKSILKRQSRPKAAH